MKSDSGDSRKRGDGPPNIERVDPMGVSVRSMSSLKAHLDFEIDLHCGLLILTEEQAGGVLKLANNRQREQSNAMLTDPVD